MFRTIILTCSKRLRDERTDQAIFHILQGKKSIQTIQDTSLYKLDTFYGILPKLKKEVFNDSIRQLEMIGHMQSSNKYDDSYTISVTGKDYVATQSPPIIFSYLNGKKHGLYTYKFEQRLFLFFQVLSNKRMHNNIYVPVIDDYQIMNDVKVLYRQLGNDHAYLAKQLHKEIRLVLTSTDEQYARIFVDRLSGFKHYGESIQQSANNYQLTEINMRILWIAIVHYILEKISTVKDEFPLLTFIHMRDDNIHLTASAQQTKRLLNKNLSLDIIASNRQLKINTIYDHIIEITLHDDSFNITSFIDEASIKKVLQTVHRLDTYQLKALKEALGEDYSYFQIRLALARGGALHR